MWREFKSLLPVGALLLLSIVFAALPRAKPVPVTAEPSPSVTPSATLAPTLPVTPRPSPTPTPVRVTIFARASSYWPPAGGTNCSHFVDGRCLSRMASLYPWQLWINKAVSCPEEWPFGTLVVYDGQTWVCLDRGGAIDYRKGIPWIDFLTNQPPAAYGSVIAVDVIFPPHESIPLPTSHPLCYPPDCLPTREP